MFTLVQMFAYICVLATGQCSNDLLAGPQVPITVRYAQNEFQGVKNVNEFVAGLAIKPRVGEWLRVQVKVYKNVDPKIARKLQDAIIADSGKIGEPYTTVMHHAASDSHQ